jgi:mersacidin/lichenicidin family type 2 lantibiotic
MASKDVIRAWKDPVYRSTLGARELAKLPSNPAGLVNLSDDQLRAATGFGMEIVTTFRTCTEFTFRQYHCCK